MPRSTALIEFSDSLPRGLARGRSMGAVAQIMMLAERLPEAIEWADRSLVEARRNGDEWLIAQALVERSSSRRHGETMHRAATGPDRSAQRGTCRR